MGTARERGIERHRLHVDAAAGPARLDAYLARRIPELSRSRIVALIEGGAVLVNGEPARKSHRPEPGDEIELLIPPAEPSHLEPEPIPLDILYEDEDLLVLNKPAGLVVHPAPGHRTGTLVHGLLHGVAGLSGIGGVKRPGIVHRLDRDTSGLMLVAKNDVAHRRLAEALKCRDVRRTYLAAAWGHLQQDDIDIDAPIGRSRSDRKRMTVVATGRPARTRLHRLERWRAAELLRVELDTGRTHQIRVHLQSIGHPVAGDATYGAGGARGMSGPDRGWARAFERRVPRQFLHAAELALTHPTTGAALRFSTPLPPDLEAAASWARTTSGG